MDRVCEKGVMDNYYRSEILNWNSGREREISNGAKLAGYQIGEKR